MARIRSTKPDFWSNGQVIECSTNARLLFIGSWNFCDDCGRHPDRPKQLKAEVFPADDFTEDDIRRMLDELESNELISRYVVDGEGYFYVTGWHHQKIDRPQPAKHPEPPPKEQRTNAEDSTNDQRTFAPDRIGKDRKGKDSSSRTKTKLSDDFELSADMRRKAESYWQRKGRSDLDADDQFEAFLANHRANGSRFECWESAWQTWYTRSIQFNRQAGGQQPERDVARGAL